MFRLCDTSKCRQELASIYFYSKGREILATLNQCTHVSCVRLAYLNGGGQQQQQQPQQYQQQYDQQYQQQYSQQYQQQPQQQQQYEQQYQQQYQQYPPQYQQQSQDHYGMQGMQAFGRGLGCSAHILTPSIWDNVIAFLRWPGTGRANRAVLAGRKQDANTMGRNFTSYSK